MGLDYKLVQWNRDKKLYDRFILIGTLSYLVTFAALTLVFNPETTAETLIIRAFGTLAILMLHFILIIGPLSRHNSLFLPLLYNRRHLGVSMFLAALVHGLFGIIQFHTLGTVNPIYSVFTSNMDYSSLTDFPFQVLGFLALLILFAMASTSHDFFLKNLSPRIWKGLHMLVYLAYTLVLMHVVLGAFQQEISMVTFALLALGFVVVAGLHISAAFKKSSKMGEAQSLSPDGWLRLCPARDIDDLRAKIFKINNEAVAVFRYEGRLSAVHNACKHQGGPLGEGKIIDGCITCPWHGYQYYPENGQSPPPFTEKIHTYELKLVDGIVYINPEALPEGTDVEPVRIEE